MLLIHCPHCDETLPELEFEYAGEAHIDRPADPSGQDDGRMARFPVHAQQRPGKSLRALAPFKWVRSVLQCRSKHGQRQVPGNLCGRRTAPYRRRIARGIEMSRYRIAGKGRVNHTKPVRFTFDGKTYSGLEGDTVASALLANGVHLLGRSFKYHRPRGVVTAGSEEPNALIGTSRGTADRYEPNTRATVQEIYEGLKTDSQNKWPSLKFDVGAINDRLYMLFSAGFYYKTFMWPKSFWDKVYEPFIRGAAGLGVSPQVPDADYYASRYLHCDVLIVGAGPAGLAAALSAGQGGVQVVIVDEHSEFGGSLLAEDHLEIDGNKASEC